MFLLLCLPTVIMANGKDEKKQDAGLWAYLSVTPKPVVERWYITYSLEYRNKENFSQTSLWCGAINVYYKFNTWLKLGAGYEYFLNRQTDGTYTPEYRYYPAALFSYQKGLFAGSFRSYLMNTYEHWKEPHWEFRNRLKISYQIKDTKLKSFVAVEPYYAIFSDEDIIFRKIRYFAGFSYSFGLHQLDAYYLREDYIYKPLINNVVALEYNMSF